VKTQNTNNGKVNKGRREFEMAIVSGVNIPDNKRVETALTSIYGIGPSQSKDVLDKAGLFDNPRVSDLSDEDLNRIREIIDKDKIVEGDLRRDVNQNIRRLIDIGCYRGSRHRRALPVRGQRTKTNARSKRGRRIAVARRHTTTK
jgi:small subunit ribosomal protein S13